MTVFSTLVIFIIFSLLVALLAALIVIVPWLRSSREAPDPVDNRLIDLNIDVYKSRLRELAADKAIGTIDDVQYIDQKTELERQLLDAEQIATPMQLPSLKGQLALIVCVPVLAICAYVLFSDRSDVFDLWRAQDRVGEVSEELLSGKIEVLPEWAFEDGAGLFTTIQTNVHRNADDSYRWMVLSEIFLSFSFFLRSSLASLLIFLIATLPFSPRFFKILIKSFLLSSVKSGILSLIICPSICGLMPSSDFWIADSIRDVFDLSHT